MVTAKTFKEWHREILALSALLLIAGCGGSLSKEECESKARSLTERLQRAQSEAEARDIMRTLEDLEADCAQSARGLGGVELVVSDAHQGLRGAIAAVFGGASWQRCRTHFMTNLLTRIPRRAQPWVATMVRTIYQQPSPDEVHAQLDRVTDQLQNRFPQVASLLDEAGPDVLAFSNFPLAHWKKIWSNNPQERLNKEIRRRTDVVGIFPNRPAVRRLVGAVLAEQHDEWAVGRRYITPVVLTFNEALPEADLAETTTPKQHQQDDALLHHLTGRDLKEMIGYVVLKAPGGSIVLFPNG